MFRLDHHFHWEAILIFEISVGIVNRDRRILIDREFKMHPFILRGEMQTHNSLLTCKNYKKIKHIFRFGGQRHCCCRGSSHGSPATGINKS